jgi:quercetin dioxygenase-like cupin family protein
MKRRQVLTLTALSPLAAHGGNHSNAIRRIVTSQDREGNHSVLQDGTPPVAFELNGTTITRLWESPSTPVDLPIESDATLAAANAYRKEFVGTSFYVADLPAGSGGDIPLHRNATLDYIAVMTGQVYLVMPEQRLLLRAGDILVQGGTLHTWENTSNEPCRLLVVVITGTDTPPG